MLKTIKEVLQTKQCPSCNGKLILWWIDDQCNGHQSGKPNNQKKTYYCKKTYYYCPACGAVLLRRQENDC